MGLIGEIAPLMMNDAAVLTEDHGSAKLDFTVGDSGASNMVMLMSKGWYEPIDLSKGLKFSARLSASLPVLGKSFLVKMTDNSGRSRVWDLSGGLTTAWASLSIKPGDGTAESNGLNPQKIVFIQFEIANISKGSVPFSASLWIDNIEAVNG